MVKLFRQNQTQHSPRNAYSLYPNLIVVLFSMLQISAAPLSPQERSEASALPIGPTIISIVAALASPVTYDGKLVSMAGYLTLEHEGTALYLDQGSSEASISANAIWIELPRQLSTEERRELSERYVSANGVFHADRRGYGESFSGTLILTDVPRALRTSDDYRAYLRREKIAARREWIPMAATFVALLALGFFFIWRRVRPPRSL